MTGPTPPPPTPGPGRPGGAKEAALALVADDVEMRINGIGRTLSDDETAAVYLFTLALVEHVLDGAKATGIVDDAQRSELGILIDGLKEAPRLM